MELLEAERQLASSKAKAKEIEDQLVRSVEEDLGDSQPHKLAAALRVKCSRDAGLLILICLLTCDIVRALGLLGW